MESAETTTKQNARFDALKIWLSEVWHSLMRRRRSYHRDV